MGILGEERKEQKSGVFKTTMTGNFPQMKVRHQATAPGRSENTKQDKRLKPVPRHTIFKLRKIKDKEKILKEVRRKTPILPIVLPTKASL